MATTLLDPKAYPFEQIAGLYRDRWIVELRLRDIKTTLGMDILRGKSADIVRKEIYMHLLVYNLIRVLMWQASKTHGRPVEGFHGRAYSYVARFLLSFADPLSASQAEP